jgi:4-hydroxybenzoate polyprenyltransferase
MREQRAFHPTIVWASIISTLPFLLYLVLTGSTLSNLTLVALLFFVVAYSLVKLRFKERPVLDSITSSIHFVGPMIFALTLTGDVWQYAVVICAFFLWGMASHALGAIQDIIPDRAGGIHSIATAFGARITYRLVAAAYFIAAVSLALYDIRLIAVSLAGLLYVLNIAPYYRITDRTSAEINRAWRRFIWLNLIAGFVVTLTIIALTLQA